MGFKIIMKNFLCIFFIILSGNHLWGQNEPRSNEWHATLKVVDESGAPMPGAEASVSYFVHPPPGQPRDSIASESISGLTDADGIFKASHRDRSISLSFSAEKDGFYRSYVVNQLGKPSDYDPVKWNPEVTLSLKRIGQPIAMYAKLIDSGPPAFNQPVGYDLIVGNWVAPYGSGQKTDIIFTGELAKKAENDFDYKLTVSFPNKGDGIQEFNVPYSFDNGSVLRSPHNAPADGYQTGVVRIMSRHPGQGTKQDRDSNRNFFFRVRTVLDANGNATSALYGKIYGDFMQFRYYLNPVPNSRDIEFDPKQNLFKNPKSSGEMLPP